MERGQIIAWRFFTENMNRGTIVGCFGNVHGQMFGFTIGDVADPGLAAFLRSNPQIMAHPNCNPAAHAFWVDFFPVGPRATSITR
jgi:hypothetical protein